MRAESAEEMEMILSIFPDEVRRHPSDASTLIVSLPFRFVLHLTIPRDYPECASPSLFLACGPNAPLVSHLSAELSRAVRAEVTLGVPALLLIITIAQRTAEELQAAQHEQQQQQQHAQQQQRDAQTAMRRVAEQSAITVWSGESICDRKSKFMAHMARVHSLQEVRHVLEHIRAQKHIAEAAHPAIYAYRFTDASSGVLQQDSDDDGETGAAIKVMFLLDQMGIDGYVIVVTRWFGGILLGPDRFKHIMEVARNMLLTIPQREEAERDARKGIGK